MRAFTTRPAAARRRSATGLLYLVISGLLWGTGGLTGSLLGRTAGLSALSVASFRLTAGGLLIVVFLTASGRRWPAGRAAWSRITSIGLLAALFQSCYFTAVALTSVPLATLVTIGAAPVIVLGVDRVTGRRTGRFAVATTGLAVTGLGLLVGLPSGFPETAVLASAGLAVVAAAGFAAVTLAGSRPVPGLDDLTVTGFSFTIGGFALMPLAQMAGGIGFRPGLAAIGLLVALGTGPTAVAYTLYFRGLRSAPASTGALLSLLEPLTGTILAAVLLGERLSATGFAGAAIIATAVILTVQASRGRPEGLGAPGPGRVVRSRGSKSQECLRDCSAGLQAGSLGFRLGSDRTRLGRLWQPQERAWTVFDTVTITHRGAKYEIGRGRDFYGIWMTGAPRTQPLDRWPETPEGWAAAWTRFASIEAPGTISPVGRRIGPALSGRAAGLTAAALLGVGVVLGIAGLFPAYLGGSGLAQQADQVVPHAIYLAVWTASAVLILLGGARLRLGALLGLGLSAVTFGLFFADAGTAIAGTRNAGGAGLVLALLGWLACAAGSVVAFLVRPASAPAGQPDHLGTAGSLARPRGSALGPVVLLVLAGLGVAAAFVPAWDTFTLRTAAGQSQSFTAGNAFSNPGLVIAGDVAVMIALAAVVIVAAFWRPVRHGAVLLAGAIAAMAAQAISALVQASETPSAAQFGISPAQASQLGLTISSGLTAAFWIYCGFLVALTVSCAWMLFTPQPAAAPVPPRRR